MCIVSIFILSLLSFAVLSIKEYSETETIPDGRPEVRIHGQVGCVTKDVNGAQAVPRLGKAVQRFLQSRRKLTVRSLAVGNEGVISLSTGLSSIRDAGGPGFRVKRPCRRRRSI